MFSIFPFIGVSWQKALFKSIYCICFPITCKEPSRLHLDEMSQSTSEELCYKSQTAAALVQKTPPWCGWYQFSIFDYSIKYTWFFPGSCRLFRTYFHVFPKNRRKTLHDRLEQFWNSLQQVLSMIASKSHRFSARQLWQRLWRALWSWLWLGSFEEEGEEEKCCCQSNTAKFCYKRSLAR